MRETAGHRLTVGTVLSSVNRSQLMDAPARRPVSTRHAFALAFDLAFRRDVLQSLVVPFLLVAPWVVSLRLLLPPDDATPGPTQTLLSMLTLLGAAATTFLVDAMLRFRARSVFNTKAGTHPAPVLDCYAAGVRRLPWLYATEFVRNVAMAVGFGLFVLPGLWMAYRLAFATEAVVLTEPHLAAAFRHSFHLARRRLERWFELIAVSVVLALATSFLVAALTLLLRISDPRDIFLAAALGTILVKPLFQYAWTFFYLRLIEVELPEPVEAGPMYAGEGPSPDALPDHPGLEWSAPPDPPPSSV